MRMRARFLVTLYTITSKFPSEYSVCDQQATGLYGTPPGTWTCHSPPDLETSCTIWMHLVVCMNFLLVFWNPQARTSQGPVGSAKGDIRICVVATRCSSHEIERSCAPNFNWSVQLLVWLTVPEGYTTICALFWYFQAPASTIEQHLNGLVLYITSFEASLLYRSIRYLALAKIELPDLIIRVSVAGRTFTSPTSSTALEIQPSTAWLLWT